MKKSYVFILLMGLFSLNAAALEIRGLVTDTAGNPLAGAVVLHRASAAKAVTGGDGEFSLTVPDADKVRLEIIHADYYEREFLVAREDFGRRLHFTLAALVRQKEDVVVTALRYPEPVMNVPAAGSVVQAATLAETRPVNITDGLRSVPGVAALGSGGFSLVPSVRGLARRRILFLIDGARLESDRRTGPNASFVSPEDIERIEVLRSPSSVFYGSDAVGGVIHMMTKRPRLDDAFYGRVSTLFGTASDEKGVGLIVGGGGESTAFQLSLQALDAGDYRMPGGAEVLQSHFTQGSLVAKVSHRTEKREIDVSFLAARGTDIGKPNSNAALKPTWYPRENQNLFQLRWTERGIGGGEIMAHAFVNPNFLETRTDTFDPYKVQESFGRTESTEFGFQVSYGKKFGDVLRLQGGLDYFGRTGARAYNSYTSFDEAGTVTELMEESPFLGGRRLDLGFFVSADYTGVSNLDVLAGARCDVLSMRAVPYGETQAVTTEDGKTTGFLALSYRLSDRVAIFANVARAYRLPSLSERFYTGISGRGFIIGQPDLVPETSTNCDAGVKFLGRRLFAGFYAFSYGIRDMIERYRVDPTTYTYGNIEEGRVKGLEFELEYFLRPGWKVFGSMFTIRGRSLVTGTPLNDIPPLRVAAGTRVWRGRFWTQLEAAVLFAKDNPGPAEIAIPGCSIIDLRAGYAWRAFDFFAVLANVLNQEYVSRPDSEAMIEPGRNLRLGLAYAF